VTARRKYEIVFLTAALRDFEKLAPRIRKRIARHIDVLADDPRVAGSRKLKGSANTWRIRVGDYRVLYTVADQRVTVTIVQMGDRKHVYRTSR
jgi:mRNA interferase RelE/StbE